MATSPTQNSLKLLRSQGYEADVSEHWNSFTRQRKDLFGFVDIVAVKPGEVLFVQTTSASNVSSRLKKIDGIEAAKICLVAGVIIHVHGWRKLKGRWVVRVEPYAGVLTARRGSV